MRRFNTEGPVRPDEHYCIPPLLRLDRNQLLNLVRDKRCFVLHAPRQTGKTSALLAFRDLLNEAPRATCFACTPTSSMGTTSSTPAIWG